MTSFWHRLPKPIKVLAPMEDVTDTVFRRIVARCGRPDVFFTEFTSADGLSSPGRNKVIHRLHYTEEERPIVAQIWGNKPEHYYETAQLLQELGFDGIDINMGCPVSTVVKKGKCSALIDNLPLAKELILAAQEGGGTLPISVKTRLGFKRLQTEEWISFLLELKLSVIIIHGRIAKHMSQHPANWDEIGKAVALRNQCGSKTLIIGNGDVRSKKAIDSLYHKYKVDGIMIGRGIFHDLFLFHEKIQMEDLTPDQKINLLLSHITLTRETWGTKKPFSILKKFFKVYLSNFRGASELRCLLMEAQDYKEAIELLNQAKSSS